MAQPQLKLASDEFYVRDYPQLIKYMGSKARILNFVVDGINRAHTRGAICDLFAGAASLSGALGNQCQIISNDIQEYSSYLASPYLFRLSHQGSQLSGENVISRASEIVSKRSKRFGKDFQYADIKTIKQFNNTEQLNRSLIDERFNSSHHLFTKYYSGTWWSLEQCVWIDALRQTIDEMHDFGEIAPNDKAFLMACTMHAMAYCGQGTGHYAQYRDAKDEGSFRDIYQYRLKHLDAIFQRKFDSLKEWNLANVADDFHHTTTSLDFKECLQKIEGGTIYADPPYAFVHYSRFYHAIETFVKYDYPELQVKKEQVVKGRYRSERHQSPFSIRTQVPDAFASMFELSSNSNANLVLSYSNTGLFELDELMELATARLGKRYSIDTLFSDHNHMTMGRRNDRSREVSEALIICKRKL